MRLVEEAVHGMLPKTKLGNAMYRKLKVYAAGGSSARGAEAAHARGRVTWLRLSITELADARRPPPACSSAPERAPSPSTTSPIEASFPTETLRLVIRQPLVLTETGERFDVLATTAGGGVAGQAGALRLGIARALVDYDAELRSTLRKAGLLTRDPRAKERKKYGMAGARKRFQFSKR